MIDSNELAEPGTEASRLLAQLDPGRLPRHIAVIMDGNGRWAGERQLPRIEGHKAGVEAVRAAVETAARLRIPYLTLYAFSQENWKRPRTEVAALMGLLQQFVRREVPTLQKHGIRLNAMGDLNRLPLPARRAVQETMRKTRDHEGLTLTLALSYGARQEIVEACRAALREGVDPESLDLERFAGYLQTRELPDPDLLIRTSGELRVSNFLLWQIAYAELWVTETLWPDFRKEDMLLALVDFQRRERRYGGVAEALAEP